MHHRYHLLFVAAFCLVISPLRANGAPSLSLSMEPDTYSCEFGSRDVAFVHVTWDNYNGHAKTLLFGAELSANSGYTFVYAGSRFNVSGDAATGFVVDLGSCTAGSVQDVMQFFVYRTSPGTPCSTFRLTPHSGYDSIRYTDCDNVEHHADRSVGLSLNSNGACPETSAPYAPYPANGATNMPLSMTLEWSFDLPQCPCICGREDDVYFGTEPSPPLLDLWGGPAYPLATLKPFTTYYWKIATRAYGLYGVSPVWSFTTTAAVAVRPTTWGAVKALYR